MDSAGRQTMRQSHGQGFIAVKSRHLQEKTDRGQFQNIQISGVEKESIGYEMSTAELALLMMDLKEMGAHTLNLITGTHYIPSIIAALEEARKMGFDLPVVWNSSGYERIEALALIDPYIDIYLLDCKTLSHSVASRFCSTSRYADVIIPVMDYVKKTHPVTDFDKMRGTLLRHLVFPGTVNETLSFLEYYSRNYKSSFFLSLMVQFVPPRSGITFDKITEEEYDTLVSALEYYEIDDGFIQELGDEDKWIPDFRNPLSLCNSKSLFPFSQKEIVVPSKLFPSRNAMRLSMFLPSMQTTRIFSSLAIFDATGSKGRFAPGFHSDPTILRKSGQLMKSSGFAFLSIFGSAVYTFFILLRFTTVDEPNRFAR